MYTALILHCHKPWAVAGFGPDVCEAIRLISVPLSQLRLSFLRRPRRFSRAAGRSRCIALRSCSRGPQLTNAVIGAVQHRSLDLQPVPHGSACQWRVRAQLSAHEGTMQT